RSGDCRSRPSRTAVPASSPTRPPSAPSRSREASVQTLLGASIASFGLCLGRAPEQSSVVDRHDADVALERSAHLLARREAAAQGDGLEAFPAVLEEPDGGRPPGPL